MTKKEVLVISGSVCSKSNYPSSKRDIFSFFAEYLFGYDNSLSKPASTRVEYYSTGVYTRFDDIKILPGWCAELIYALTLDK
jgi:hypothetical protein